MIQEHAALRKREALKAMLNAKITQVRASRTRGFTPEKSSTPAPETPDIGNIEDFDDTASVTSVTSTAAVSKGENPKKPSSLDMMVSLAILTGVLNPKRYTLNPEP